MAVRVADTIKPLNDGNFPIVDAQDVNMGDGKRLSQMKGAPNGFAELNSEGKVPSSQLPSYVDDVVEYPTYSDLPVTGESGKIYITLDTNKTYRWGGTEYVPIGSDLALGTTSSTAFRGDYGQAAYEHATDANKTSQNVQGLYKMKVSDEGHPYDLQGVVKQDILDLGIDQPSANPTLVGTEDTLTGIEIGGVKFKMPTGSSSQVSTMPTPVAGLVGTVVQYVGATNENFTNGYFYKCIQTYAFTAYRYSNNYSQSPNPVYCAKSSEGAIYTGEPYYLDSKMTNQGGTFERKNGYPYINSTVYWHQGGDVINYNYSWQELEVQSKVPQYSSVVQKLTGDTSVAFDNLDSTKNYKLLAETQDGSLIGIVSCAQSNGTASGTIKLTYTIDKIVASQSPVNFKLEISS